MAHTCYSNGGEASSVPERAENDESRPMKALICSPMRPFALLLLTLVLLLGLSFFLFSEGEGVDAPLSLTRGPESSSPVDSSGPADPAHPTASGMALPETGSRALGLQGAPLGHRASMGPGRLDVLVLDRTGGALLGAAGSLPLGDQPWVQVVLGRGSLPLARDPLKDHDVAALPRPLRQTSQRPGWRASLTPPDGEAYIALAFGEFVVAAVPIRLGADRVELVAGVRDFDQMYASIEGSLAGELDASEFVRIRPQRPSTSLGGERGTSFGPGPPFIQVEGQGSTFRARRLPPGKMTVVVRGAATSLGPALHAAREAKGLSALSMGARVPDAEQWELRLGVVRQLQQPLADISLELIPGEKRQLGSLSVERAAAVVLDLVDVNGRPADATSVDVMVLADPAEVEETVLTWTFESSASVYPLYARRTELMVVQGDLGALVRVRPAALKTDVPIARLLVALQPLSVVLLPESGPGEDGARLLTGTGHRVRIDRRWIGSRYYGHEIRGRRMAVPAGSYRIEEAGVATAVSVGPGEFIDASSGSPLPAAKLEGDMR